MADTENDKTETSNADSPESTQESKQEGSAFPSPIPALVRESDRAARPGFRSPANNKTKAQRKDKKKRKGGKKRR